MSWTCGDCGTEYDESVDFCTLYLNDYLSLRGGSIESAINRAVWENMEPVIRKYRAPRKTVVEYGWTAWVWVA